MNQKIKDELYKVLKNSSLFNYCIFNHNQNNQEKIDFLKNLSLAVNSSTWFDVNAFINMGEKPHHAMPTQVAIVDKQTKKEEFEVLSNVFTEDEIRTLITIIKEMKSYGVYPIKELMDCHDEINKPSLIDKVLQLFTFKPVGFSLMAR